jgi:hypothetical protein
MNLDMRNLVNFFILSYNISTFKLNGNSPRDGEWRRWHWDNVEQDEFRIRDDPNAILDEYLGGEELQELILEKRNVFDNDLPQETSRIDVFDGYKFFN